MKESEYKGIDVAEMVKVLAEKRTEILDHFSAAYLSETGLMPSEVELVCVEHPIDKDMKIIHTYYFRRKDERGE